MQLLKSVPESGCPTLPCSTASGLQHLNEKMSEGPGSKKWRAAAGRFAQLAWVTPFTNFTSEAR